MTPKIWFGPDLRAPVAGLTDRPNDWQEARGVVIRSGGLVEVYQQQPAADDPASYNPVPDWVKSVGENNYPNLLARGFFFRLWAMGLDLGYEGPGPKNWNPATPGTKVWSPEGLALSVDQACHAHRISVGRIQAAGGKVKVVSVDDPYAACKSDFEPALTLQQGAEATARVIRQLYDLGIRDVGITEAVPTCSAEEIIDFFGLLQQMGCSPRHLMLDVDEQALRKSLTEAKRQELFRKLYAACRSWTQGEAVCEFGVIINGQRAPDPAEYESETMRFLGAVHDWCGEWPQIVNLHSWKTSDPAMAARWPNGLPENLPESDKVKHAGIVNAVAQVTGGS